MLDIDTEGDRKVDRGRDTQNKHKKKLERGRHRNQGIDKVTECVREKREG